MHREVLSHHLEFRRRHFHLTNMKCGSRFSWTKASSYTEAAISSYRLLLAAQEYAVQKKKFSCEEVEAVRSDFRKDVRPSAIIRGLRGQHVLDSSRRKCTRIMANTVRIKSARNQSREFPPGQQSLEMLSLFNWRSGPRSDYLGAMDLQMNFFT